MRHVILACLALAVVWITSGCSARTHHEQALSHPIKVCVQGADWLEPRCFSLMRVSVVPTTSGLVIVPQWEEMTGRSMEPDAPEAEAAKPEGTHALPKAPQWQATPY